jgi:hypothetical protein
MRENMVLAKLYPFFHPVDYMAREDVLGTFFPSCDGSSCFHFRAPDKSNEYIEAANREQEKAGK